MQDRKLVLTNQPLPLLDRVSGERIRSELDLTFGEERNVKIMARLQSLGLLEAIHPELVWDAWLAERFAAVRTFAPPVEWRLKSGGDVNVLYTALFFFFLGRGGAPAP